MQHRYFGDVGDFGKYGLLRALCGAGDLPRLKLGIIWYLFPDESHNKDGKHVGYLRNVDSSFRDCDELLYDKLRSLLFDGSTLIPDRRHLSSAEALSIFPEDTIFYSRPLSYERTLRVSDRLAAREEWIKDALFSTKSADLVFMDPDNGLECASVSRTSAKGPKYAYWDDIDAFVNRGQSVLVYHHLNRSKPHGEQIAEKIDFICRRYREEIGTCALTFKKGTARAYFLIALPRHKDLLFSRMMKISNGGWGHHFLSNSHSIGNRGPTALHLKGIFHNSASPPDPEERAKAWGEATRRLV
jgi:hypothetical protein